MFVPYVLLCSVLSSFAYILMGKRELVALLCLSFWCLVTVIVLWPSLNMVPWFGLQCVFLVFPEHTRLLFESFTRDAMEVSKMLLGPSFDKKQIIIS